MSLSVSHRILYVGDRVTDAAALASERDHSFGSSIVARTAEVEAVLAREAPFDLVIIDHCLQQIGGVVFLERLHRHSPEAERLIIAPAPEPAFPGSNGADEQVAKALKALQSAASFIRGGLGEAQRHVDGW